MPKPLDRAELEAAAEAATNDIEQSTDWLDDYEIILAALTAIAKRALEQAATTRFPAEDCASELIVGEPPVLLSVACAALEKPKENDAPTT